MAFILEPPCFLTSFSGQIYSRKKRSVSHSEFWILPLSVFSLLWKPCISSLVLLTEIPWMYFPHFHKACRHSKLFTCHLLFPDFLTGFVLKFILLGESIYLLMQKQVSLQHAQSKFSALNFVNNLSEYRKNQWNFLKRSAPQLWLDLFSIIR